MTPNDKKLLEEWMDTHDNVTYLLRQEWCDKRTVGVLGVTYCSQRATYKVDFGPDSVSEHARCETHAVQVVRSWTALEAERKRREGKVAS